MSTNKLQQKYKIDPRRWPGVYGYDSTRHTHLGKPDTCYYITFKKLDLGKSGDKNKLKHKLVWEKIGWRSEGITPQIPAEERATKLRKLRHGEEVKTNKEIRIEKLLNDHTLAEIADAYFESHNGKNIKGRRTDYYRYNKNLKPLLGNRRVSTILESDIDDIKSGMSHNASDTIHNALELLRRLVNFGVKKQLYVPLSFRIEMPRRNNEVTEYLRPEEAKRLWNVLEFWPSQDVSRMLKLAMLSGLRRGEIFKLQDDDLDFRQRLIWLRDPKGGRTVTVPMSEPVKTLLNDQIKWRDKNFEGSTFIFPGRYGGQRVSSNAVKKIKLGPGFLKNFGFSMG